MKISILLLVSLAWMGADGSPFFGHEYERTPVGDAIDKASLKILKEVYDSSDDKNVITSPLGVQLLLSLYSTGVAAGSLSKAEIDSFLKVTEPKEGSESYGSLSNRLAELDPSYFTLANKVYVADKYVLDDKFANTARRDYRSEVDKLDFSKPQQAADIINSWSDEKTRGHIKTPVSPDILTPDTAAALFNVIFFQGHWHVPFKAEDTTEKDFHVNSTFTVKKPTMKLLQSLFYTESEELGAKMIELPYKESGFRMVVVLPNEVDGLPAVLEKASQKGLLEDVFKLHPSGRDVELEMPKFEIKSKLDFNPILEKIGISKIFTEPATGIVKDKSVTVSKAFQEAFVKVDEEGATAGAFTGVVYVYQSSDSTPPPPMKIAVDHPFMFIILHEDKMLFAGVLSH